MTNQGKFANDYGLKDQIRRAAISIPSNIAEGDELNTDKQSIRHFYYAKGSTAELLTQSLISFEIGYIDKNDVPAHRKRMQNNLHHAHAPHPSKKKAPTPLSLYALLTPLCPLRLTPLQKSNLTPLTPD